MDSKEIIIICLTAILVALILGGAIVMANSNNQKGNPVNHTNVSNNVTADKLSFDNISTDDDDIVSVEIEYSEHYGGYIRQVNYKDGGFRQFDLDSGDLIGSSYPEDQKYLPSME